MYEVITERIATRGKGCTGSLDGETFMYADGTTDNGVVVVYLRWESGEYSGSITLDVWEGDYELS